jgi:hypothetical protein
MFVFYLLLVAALNHCRLGSLPLCICNGSYGLWPISVTVEAGVSMLCLQCTDHSCERMDTVVWMGVVTSKEASKVPNKQRSMHITEQWPRRVGSGLG